MSDSGDRVSARAGTCGGAAGLIHEPVVWEVGVVGHVVL